MPIDYNTIKFLESISDIIGLCMCGIVIVYIIMKNSQSFVKETGPADLNNFNEQVFVQIVKQQTEISFEKIFEVIKKEQLVIHELIGSKKSKQSIPVLKEKSEPILKNKLRQTKDLNTADNNAPSKDVTGLNEYPYDEIVKLLDSGNNIDAIAKQLKIPKGEIELIVNLKNFEHESY